MSDRQVQVNIRLAESSADRLKGLAESAGLKIGAFVERMIAAYSTDSKLLQLDSKAGSWQSGIEELRGLIASQEGRLNALEMAVMSGLDTGGRKVRVSVSAAENEAVETNDDASSHPTDSSPTAPNRADFERQLDERIVAFKNNGMGIKRIMAELKIGQKRVYRRLKAAGLVE
jgi:DNA-binding NtrC family response regulator